VSQINVNTPPPVESSSSGDRSAAAGINLITVLIVLGVIVVLGWYLFTGPLSGMMSGGTTTVNVNNPAPPAVNVNAPAAPAAPAATAAPAKQP
jgi:hypothetical protein